MGKYQQGIIPSFNWGFNLYMKTISKKNINIEDPVYDKTFIITDQCMWEMNKQNRKSAPHAVGVVDEETGQLRYIKSGSRIKFVSGDITMSPNQEDYNKQNG